MTHGAFSCPWSPFLVTIVDSAEQFVRKIRGLPPPYRFTRCVGSAGAGSRIRRPYAAKVPGGCSRRPRRLLRWRSPSRRERTSRGVDGHSWSRDRQCLRRPGATCFALDDGRNRAELRAAMRDRDRPNHGTMPKESSARRSSVGDSSRATESVDFRGEPGGLERFARRVLKRTVSIEGPRYRFGHWRALVGGVHSR